MVIFSSLEPNDAFDASIPYFVGKISAKANSLPFGIFIPLSSFE